MNLQTAIRTLLFAACMLFIPSSAVADVLCLKVTGRFRFGQNRIILRHKVRSSTCRKGWKKVLDLNEYPGAKGEQGEPGPQGDPGVTGPQGAQGPVGTDGSIRIYGDGSAGDLVVSGATSLNQANLQFSSVVIESGGTLTVESGTVLRVSGNFSNEGTLNVNTFAAGGRTHTIDASMLAVPFRPAQAGLARSSAMNGSQGTSAGIQSGGLGGNSISEPNAATLLAPGTSGGGGGGAGFSEGGAGGGALVVIASGDISNSGVINANGAAGGTDGGGGGGGGIVLLAALTSLSNTGSINTNGGNGGPRSVDSGPGGGGGGGVIHFLSPTIPNTGVASVAGGSGSAGGVGVTNTPRAAGGGGGASGGAGGQGGDVFTNNTAGAGIDGATGWFIQTLADPTSLF